MRWRMKRWRSWRRVEVDKWDGDGSNLELLRTPYEESPETRAKKRRG
jgi:hypothetical protein